MTQKNTPSAGLHQSSLGQRIRELRTQKGLTQIELAKNLCTPSMISQIESDRARPSFKVLARLADRLEVSIEKLLQEVNLDLEVTATYKMAVSMMKAREHASAIPLFKELLDMPRLTFPTMELRLHLGKCYLAVGEFDRAFAELKDVLELATFHKDSETLTDALTYIANLYRQKHEIQLAVHYSERAKEEFEKLAHPDPLFRANFLNELASLYHEIGKIAEACTYYEELAAMPQEWMTVEGRSKVYLELAKISYKSGDLIRCEKYASKALTLLEHVDVKSKVMDLKKDLILLKSPDPFEETIQELLSYVYYFEKIGDSIQAGETYAGIASLYLEHGDGETAPEQAQVFAEKARKLVPELHPVTGDVHRILSIICFLANDQHQGVKHLKKAMAIFQKHELISKLEEVVLLYSQCLSQEDKKDEALEELRKFQRFMITTLEKRGIGL